MVGALNVDLVVAGVSLPRPGETVTDGHFETHQGGKGANAAVAAARALRNGPLEGRVAFVGAVGGDAHGRVALDALRAEGVSVDRVAVRPREATGVALILVAPQGENQIAVAPGANATLEPGEVEAAVATLLRDGGLLLASLEVPAMAVEAAARAAQAIGAAVIVDPAPAAALTDALLDLAAGLTPNEGELAALGGATTLRAGRPNLHVAVTLGAAGARLIGPDREVMIPALPVSAVDTTGAGDTFSGVLAAGLLEGRSWAEATGRAVAAAGLSVTAAGAREGMPEREAIERALGPG